jgi:hypothetical protein
MVFIQMKKIDVGLERLMDRKVDGKEEGKADLERYL